MRCITKTKFANAENHTNYSRMHHKKQFQKLACAFRQKVSGSCNFETKIAFYSSTREKGRGLALKDL